MAQRSGRLATAVRGSLLVLAIVLVAAAVLLWRSPSRRSGDPPARSALPAAPEPEPLADPSSPAHPDAPAPAERAPAVAEADPSGAEPTAEFRPLDLYGRVLEATSGAAIPGATVVVTRGHPTAGGAEIVAELATDDRGCFRLADVGRREQRGLFVEAEGFAPHARSGLTGRAATIRLRRLHEPVALRLAWREGRRPIEGAAVRVVGNERSWDGTGISAREWISDARGRVRLDGLAPEQGAYLRVRLPGSLDVLRLIEEEDWGEEIELLFDHPRTLVLRLVSLDHGLALASLAGTIDGFGAFTSDGAGLVRMDVLPESLEERRAGWPLLHVDVEGFCRSGILLHEGLFDGAPQDVPLTRGWTVRGTVRDAGGRPLPAAHVSQENGGCQNLKGPADAFPGLPPGITIRPPRFRPVETAPNGSYTLECAFTACQDTLVIRATLEGHSPARAEVPVPEAGGEAVADLVLEPWRASLVGRVLCDGEPFPCRISASRRGSLLRSCETDDAGGYELVGLEPGPVMLEVWSSPDPNEVSSTLANLHEEELTLAPGETRHDVSLRDDRRSLAGAVRRADGEPVAGALVYVRDPESGRWTGASRGRGGEETRSDAAGRFRLSTRATDPTVELVALAGHLLTSRQVRPGDENVQLVLPASARLELDVRTPEGAPVQKLFLVEGWPAGEPHGPPSLASSSRAGADGVHDFVLAAGSWDLELLVVGFARTSLSDVEVRPGVPPLRVVLDEGITLQVRYENPPESLERLAPFYWEEQTLARYEAGDPYTGIAAHSLGWRLPAAPEGGEVPHLAAGTYVIAPLGDWRLEPERFTIEPGSAPAITFRWRRDEAR